MDSTSVDKYDYKNDEQFAKNDLDLFICPRCEKSLPSLDKVEHEDWHLALDLQAQEEHGSAGSTYAAPPTTTQHQQSAYSQTQISQQNAQENAHMSAHKNAQKDNHPLYAPPSHPPPSATVRWHTNPVIEAGRVRARDEQYMQNELQKIQFQYGIYNSDIEPEHETDYPCSCPIHNYQRMKWARYEVQKIWSQAVMFPGEKAYNDDTRYGPGIFSSNPYRIRVISPYGFFQSGWAVRRPQPHYHAQSIHQTINLNNSLNAEALRNIDSHEPKYNIWDINALETELSTLTIAGSTDTYSSEFDVRRLAGDRKDWAKGVSEAPQVESSSSTKSSQKRPHSASKLSHFRKAIGIKTSEERGIHRTEKRMQKAGELRHAILEEERGRWPDDEWRRLVTVYQEKIGMAKMVADLRVHRPIQYLHLLRAGYFEPIPIAWANQNSNPLKFSIEAAVGWRGITPAWRGYEDTAEERLYWVLNHREGSMGMRMKPDIISELNMARDRMAQAVEPPPQYYDATDTCHTQHTSEGYSKQVMPRPFVAYDRLELPTDDTMILLDVSGSMDFDPMRPIYEQYLITGYSASTQPKNKDVARAIIRRFSDAMSNHDHSFEGYDLVTFSNEASYIGRINHQNFTTMWRKVRFGGGTRVMTGWQKVKELHFQKHSESAIHHPEYGWQAGPETPMLRLLLLLDGEATDMDEFELDLLSLSWAHVTIFLIGVDGCPHHHRHANELQRISDVNHHVSLVDAQGNMPERFVTHELLKRHLGYAVSMEEFLQMEELPAYSET
ncbi:hypothetical protein DV736_g5356, partial [Chaetothyriales sp. CBS 134916]